MTTLTSPSLSGRLPRSLAALLAVLITATMLLFTATAADAVQPSRDYPRIPKKCASSQEKIPQKPVVCHLNPYKAGRPTVVMWGDSHAWMFIPAVQKAAGGKVNLVASMMGGCPAMDNQVRASDSTPACFQSNRMGIEYVRSLVDDNQIVRVIIGGSWQRYRQAVKTRAGDYAETMGRAMVSGAPRLARTLSAMDVPVKVIGQVATVPEKRAACRAGEKPYACNVPKSKALADAAGTKSWVTKLFKPAKPGKLIDVNGLYCKGSVCKGKVGKTFTWWDDLHLSATTSKRASRFFKPIITEALAAATPTNPGGGGGGGGGCTLLIFCR
ncbi:SGNH hydrolase domain-containing protein [Nocardioides sp. R-C-SC26]|uniref:SGNH hydrolase domain-containing protein n=1 Tax=Nocardioides sp. R-C-SC26 TaxID=2870414 RepID=UPI001E3F472A|nr:SGNH hydrolase domain-containing protein [Nocardioides sp. R-C-SC26]